MLLFIWACVVTSAFMPGGVQIASLHSSAAQAHIRSHVETVEAAPAAVDPRLLRARARAALSR